MKIASNFGAVALLAVGLFGSSANAGRIETNGFIPVSSPTYWNHNGSLMTLVASGRARAFYYEIPREGMIEAGVGPGTLLFKGWTVGRVYEGMAYIFNRRCGAFGYRVTGPILEGYHRVSMQGMAPIVGARCNVVGYRPDVLEFYLTGH